MSAITAQKFINSYLPTFTLNASAGNQIINGIYEASLFQAEPILPTSSQNTTNPQYQIYAGMTLTFDGGVNLARARAEKMDQKRSLFKTKELSNETKCKICQFWAIQDTLFIFAFTMNWKIVRVGNIAWENLLSTKKNVEKLVNAIL